MSSTSFPGGTFLIVNEGLGSCLTGVETANDPDVALKERGGADGQHWYVENGLLINTMKFDLRGRFSLYNTGMDVNFTDERGGGDYPWMVSMMGVGSTRAGKWQFTDGHIHRDGDPGRVLSQFVDDDLVSMVLVKRGGENERWRCEKVK